MKFIAVVSFAAVLTTSFLAMACPNLEGNYQVTKDTSSDEGTQSPMAKLVITQTGCQEVDLTTVSAQAGSQPVTVKFIPDGQTHPWGGIGDVGVVFTMTTEFQGAGVAGVLGMTSLPGQKVGSIGLTLDSTGNTLTYSMATPGSSFEITAVRK